ncbi:apses-domain-containing protein [Amniculicola lignicola CBS 123094]|uniref:Apses-domain-containing protein n=1 Tax=Amniculicola lignicola CBS 123094 TaxID=1392246 RepID=A0A6A5X1L9_9PLEO|nr:apses-domain-containing protein [Amniculicola lignicola CBS 123094]
MPPAPDGKIYSATYSNVPVYEFNCAGNHVMRRRIDDWINATHILKVAEFDKPSRTRILEREVQKGVHEKVQGGYGKYQGTWIPLPEGRGLAERNNVLAKLLPIFDYVPGDRSPPPAPKHATAASNRPKTQRQTAAAARRNGNNMYSLEAINSLVTSQAQAQAQAQAHAHAQAQSQSQVSEDPYPDSQMQSHYREDTPENESVVSESMLGDHDMMHASQYPTSSRKRKRGADQMSTQDQQHQIWADALLDYFMLLDSEAGFIAPPEPPPNVDLDRAIDEKGHSALHWAAAMGDVEVVKELINRGARIDCLSNNLETPLMRAVMFTNNFDKHTMPSMVKILQQTVVRQDWNSSTVFHHIAATTSSANKFICARYYLDCIINKLLETWDANELAKLLNHQDAQGDTALHIAARHGARKCVRSLLGRSVAVDIPNKQGEVADDVIRILNQRRRMHNRARQASSSPFAPPLDQRGMNGHAGDIVVPTPMLSLPFPAFNSREPRQFHSQTAANLLTKVAPVLQEKCEELAQAYDSELREKEAESIDAERVVNKRRAELEAIRKQKAELAGGMNGLGQHMDLNDEELDRQQEHELRMLVDEAQSLLEIEQKIELRRMCASTAQHYNANSPVDLNEKMRLALLLHRAQIERRELVQEVVGNLSVAGMSERQGAYKKLIAKALGEREEDIEGMLPEILKELEEAEIQERAEGFEGSPL